MTVDSIPVQQSDDMLAQSIVDDLQRTMRTQAHWRDAARVCSLGAVALGCLILVRFYASVVPSSAVAVALLLAAAAVLVAAPVRWLSVAAASVVALALLVASGWSVSREHAPAVGWTCALMEVFAALVAVAPLIAVSWRNGDRPSYMGRHAAAAALMIGSCMLVVCAGSESTLHVLVFHLLPVAVLVAAMHWVTQRVRALVVRRAARWSDF